MKIRVVETERDFDALEAPWERLCEKTPSSFFSSFDYVRTAWKHFHKATDRLFLLVLSDGSSIEGIAPFYIRRCRTRGIPHRVIRFISTWEGDRPRILSSGNEASAWREILDFLEKAYHYWEILELAEQPVEGPDGKGWAILSRPGLSWERMPGGVDYYISLKGSWDQYLSGLSCNTRRNWRKQARRLSALPGGYAFERVTEPSKIHNALLRFVAIEQGGWKAEVKIGVGKDERHLAFYKDLLVHLCGKGQVEICFLKCNDADLAGLIAFAQRDVSYLRHTAYAPAYASYSPGILLHAEIIGGHFGGAFREVDLLAMREDGSSQKHKTAWATGRRETVQWIGYRLRSRILPLVLAKRLKSYFTKAQRKTENRTS